MYTFRATAAGLGAIGVVVVAGESAFDCAAPLFKPKKADKTRKEGRIFYGHIVEDDEVVDEALWVWYEKHPRWCCEVVELNCHGGVAVVERVLEGLIRRGAKRVSFEQFLDEAVEKGWISGIYAEAEKAVLRCASVAGLRVLSAALDGELERKVKEILAFLECGKLYDAEENLRRLLVSAEVAVRSVFPPSFLLLGAPNSGKSSLFNRLVGAERVIVSPVAGTTVDVIEGAFGIDEYIIKVYDAAGVGGCCGVAESFTIRFAEKVDFLLYLIDGSVPLEEKQKEMMRGLDEKRTLTIINKADLPLKVDGVKADGEISALTGKGIEELKRMMLKKALKGEKGVSLPSFFTKRQIRRGKEALDALKSGDFVRARKSLRNLMKEGKEEGGEFE
ncbi:MAG: 50S ribosome-binding GTPase [Planctomycetota bacterium]|nr:50S ribosome-binding GTPase [Planctomycetota bacterium]